MARRRFRPNRTQPRCGDSPLCWLYAGFINTLDNVKSPTSGLYAEIKQDFAGVGGDVNFIRSQGEIRNYLRSLPRRGRCVQLKGGNIASWGGQDLRMLDHFQMGPDLVRGFAPNGIGPRDISPVSGSTNDALGGSLYWGATAEAQTPTLFLAQDVGIKIAVFAMRARWGLSGATHWDVTKGDDASRLDDPMMIRSSVGGRLALVCRRSVRCVSNT